MDSLSETAWDILILGTGLPQSLLALALSKSGKKVLHLDKNDYYGGSEAALSLDDAVKWVERVNNGSLLDFDNAALINHDSQRSMPEGQTSRLSPSRSYSLSLAPQIVYARAKLLNALVSSGIHQQLEFQAVGSWWLCKGGKANSGSKSPAKEETSDYAGQHTGNTLQRIPSSREDVFSDATLDVKSKRSLMKFLRSTVKDEDANPGLSIRPDAPFSETLAEVMRVPSVLHDPLLALSLLPTTAGDISTETAMSRIRRHLVSIGVFGAGFAAVIPKWGGVSEIAQVGCRAGAVGGGTYVLGRSVNGIEELNEADSTVAPPKEETGLEATLSNGEKIKTRWIAASPDNIPQKQRGLAPRLEKSARTINIVSSSLDQLFPPTSENGPVPACAIVMLPASSASHGTAISEGISPVYLSIHSSDTGECPSGQCIIYASAPLSDPSTAYPILDAAVNKLLTAVDDPSATVLWQLRYIQSGLPPTSIPSSTANQSSAPTTTKITSAASQSGNDGGGGILLLPPPSLDLAFDDSVVDAVKEVWAKIVGVDLNAGNGGAGGDGDGFMVFPTQRGDGNNDNDDDDGEDY